MVYKKYVYKKGRKHGPYYYFSYREGSSVKKIYIGGKKEYKVWLKNQKRKKSSFGKSRTTNFFSSPNTNKKLFIAFILILLIISGFFGYAYFKNNNEVSSQVSGTGKAVLEISNSVYNSIAKIIGFSVEEQEQAPEQAEQETEEQQEAEEQVLEDIETIEEIADETEQQQETIVEEEIETNITEEEILTNITIPETIENVTEINITIPEDINFTNITVGNITEKINITIPEITDESNITTNITIPETPEINETIINATNKTIIILDEDVLNIITRQYRAVINRPVKWIKILKIENLSETEDLTLEIPKQAVNITIRTGGEVQEALNEIEEYGQIIEQTDRESIAGGGITGFVSLDLKESKGILTKLIKWLRKLTITGHVIEESELEEEIIETVDKKEINITDIVKQTNEEDISVEYYTDAPTAKESDITKGKQVIVSGPDELNYIDVLAYSLLDNEITVSNSDEIKIYWVKNIEQTESIQQEEDLEKETEEQETAEQEQETAEINETQQTSEIEIINETELINNKTISEEQEIEKVIDNPSAELNNLIDINNIIKNNETIEQAEEIAEEQQTSPITAFAINENELNNLSEELNNENNSSAELNNLTNIDNEISNIVKELVNFTIYDLDEDGMIDYIEWIVPHLSEQTYEIVIGEEYPYNILSECSYEVCNEPESGGKECNAIFGECSFINDNGIFKEFTDVVDLSFDKESGNFTYSYKDEHSITSRIIFIMDISKEECNANEWDWRNKDNLCFLMPDKAQEFIKLNNISSEIIIMKNFGYYKYAMNVTGIPLDYQDNLAYVGLYLEKENGLTWDDVKEKESDKNANKEENNGKDKDKGKEKSLIVKDKIKLGFNDLEESGFSVQFYDKRTILIGNVRNKENLWLDPLSSVTGETSDAHTYGENSVYATARTDSSSYSSSANYFFVGQYYYDFCSGTATTCESYDSNQASCDAQAGCGAWFEDCPGTATSCTSFDSNQASCNAQAGCGAWFSDCPGTASTCNSFDSNEAGCGTQAGCGWPGCYGNPAQCSGVSYIQCIEYGCSWEGSCTGTPTECSYWPDDDLCTVYDCTWSGTECTGTADCNTFSSGEHSGISYCSEAGCSWSGQECYGSATPCNNFDSDEIGCGDQGCLWEGCNGTASTCTSFDSNQASCNAQAGCGSWFSDCPGTATSCTSFDSNQASCNAQAGCGAWFEDCPGTATSCGSLNEAGCGATTNNPQYGCAWGETYDVYRGYLDFNTSSIPDNAVVSDVKLNLNSTSVVWPVAYNISIYDFNWQEPIAVGNQESNYDASGAVYDALFKSSPEMSDNNRYNSSSLNNSWINLTGDTKYQLRSSRDVNSIEPYQTERVAFRSAESAGNEPRLYVTYTVDVTAPTVTITSIGGDSAAPYSTSDTSPIVLATTDENADCRASVDEDESYDDMSNNIDCTGDGGTSHTCNFGVILESASVTFYVACNDSAGNKNTAANNEEAAAEIDASPPTQSNHDPAKGSTITTNSPTITFTTNENGDCRASLLNESYSDMSNDVDCTGDGGTSHTCVMSGLSEGVEIVHIACRDDTDVTSNNDTVATNEQVNYIVDTSDPTYPSFSLYWDNNATLTGSGTGKFNVTLKNTNGTVILHINGTNIYATNLSANVYNVSYIFGSSGTYLYNWTAYGNGTSHNMNISANRNYVVNTSDPTYPSFSSYWDDTKTLIGGGTGKFNVTLKNTNGTVFLRINGTSIYATNLSANVYNVSYTFGSSGTYLYNWTAYGNGTGHNMNISANRNYLVNTTAASQIGLSLVTPAVGVSEVNVTKNAFFYVDVNVTCYISYCGEINVSLDPEQSGRSLGTEESLVTIQDGSTIIQDRIKINEPVKWRKHIQLQESINSLRVNLPEQATKINVEKIVKEAEEETQKRISITGNVIIENKPNFILNFFRNMFSTITGNVVAEAQEDIVVIIEDNATEYEVEYETPAPKSIEKQISENKKTITISAPDELNYTNVLASTELLVEVPSETINLYHLTENGRQRVEVTKYDKNDNGLIDYIEWNVPHLSEQTYELIIEIIKAEHLDKNKKFISDIYSEVYKLDNIWSEPINNKEYVRVSFKQNLTNQNDITIYARSVDDSSAKIEVYAGNSNKLITKFENINEEKEYKVYLTNIPEGESYKTFDLKIVDGAVEFDYIVDPTIAPAQIIADSALIDVVAESGVMNFTHLNISGTAPYDSLVGYWSFDGDKKNTATTTHYDFTKNNNDGTGVGNAVVNNTNCLYGDCIKFNGTKDYLNLGVPSFEPDFMDGGSNWTVSMFLQMNNGAKTDGQYSETLFGGWQSASDFIDIHYYNNWGSDAFRLYMKGTWAATTILSNTFIADNVNFFHFAIVYNGTNISFYVNSAQTGGGAVTSSSFPDGTTSWMGMARGVFYSNFSGSMDEIMIFNIDLTPAQVLDIYNNQSARFKSTGTQVLDDQTVLNISSGNNRVNITTDFETKFGSKLSLSVGYYDGSWSYTAPQNLTSGSVHTFETSSTTTNLTLNYTHIAGNQSNPFYTPILNGSIVLTAWNEAAAEDTIYPSFSNYWDNNATLTGSGTGKFNVTLKNTNGTVILHINGTSIYATNLSANVYNVSYTFGSSGTYLYNWTAYGNGTSHNLNTSANKYYTVNSTPGVTPKGLINTTIGATPFYTNESNPRNITLDVGQSQVVRFWVNATAAAGNNYTFFAYANKTSEMSISNITSSWTVFIVGNIIPVVSTPQIVPSTPKTSENLNCTFTVVDDDEEDTLAVNITWYKNGATSYTTGRSVTNNVLASNLLTSGNTSAGETWICGVRPYDGTNFGVIKNSTGTLILDSTNPTITLISPANASYVDSSSVYFVANFTDNSDLKNATLYIWNSTSLIITNTTTIKGVANSSNLSYVLPREDTYLWNYYVCDNASNCIWNVTNYTLTYAIPQIGLSLVTPAVGVSKVNASQNVFFNVTFNVSCLAGNCGEINVSLDPVVKGTSSGFVTVAPSADPTGTTLVIDTMAWATKHTAPVGATRVVEIGWWCDTATEAADFDVGIYDHNVGDNNPEAKVGDFSVNNAKGTTAGWKRVTGLNIPITAETIYWISVQVDDTATATSGDYSAVGGEKFDRQYGSQTELIDPWGASHSTFAVIPAIYAVYETTAGPAEKGLINTTIGATPFYTNESNPRNISLGVGENQLVVFWVNATGTAGYNYTFFGYVNKTSDMSISNITSSWNVSIVDFSDTTAPTLTVTAPADNSNFNISSVTFNITGSETLSWCGLSISGTANKTMTGSGTAFGLTNSSISNGRYTFIVSCNDTSNNFGYSSSYNFYIDTVYPWINFTSPTPASGSTQANTNIFVNVTSSDTASNISTFIDFDNSLVGWWRMDDTNGSANSVLDISGHCYDNDTEILTDEGWKLFSELNKNEKVATLNQETKELEYQTPLEYQEFENNKEMYKILLGDGSDLLVSEKHRVYAAENNFGKGLVSFVVVSEENENNNFVLFINPEFENLIFHNVDSPFTSEVISKGFVMMRVKKDFFNLIFNNLSQERVFSSSFINLFFTNSSKSELVIHFDESNSLKNSSAELYTLPVSFKAFFNNSICLGLGGNSSTGCQSICSQNSQSSSVTSPVCLYLLDMSCFKTSINAFPSNLDATLDWSSLGNCIFISSILIDNIENSDYLSFSIGKNLSNFKLQSITEIYEEINQGKDIYFSDSENNPIKVKSITKEQYNGKIYDVDVENDIVLVRRENKTALWSGNSNNGTAQGGASQTLAGKMGKGFKFDGDGDYINSSVNSITTNLSISAWFKQDSYVSDSAILDAGYVDNYLFGYFTSNAVRFYVAGVGNVATSTKADFNTDMNWHHLVGTFDGQTIRLYIDGAQNGTDTSTTYPSGTTSFNIGVYDSSAYFNGTIDDVMIFNRSLSADEVKGLYANASVKHVNNNFTSLADGSHAFKAYTQDYGGNVNSTETRQVTIDTGIPTITITSPLNQTYTTTTISFNITLNEAGSWCGVSLDNAANITMTANASNKGFGFINSTMSQGSHSVVFACNDTLGNMNASSGTRAFTVDTTAPVVTITSPTNTTYTTSSISFNFTLNEAGSCMYSLNAGVTNYTMTANSSNTGFNATNSSISDGSYTARAYCNDTAGNTNYTTSVVFSKDTSGPTITIVNPANNSNFNTSSVTFNVTGSETLTWCGLSIDNTANKTMQGSGTAFGLTNSSISDGTHTFIVSCNDSYNNYGASSSYSFYIDTVYPAINFTNPTPASGSTQPNTNIFVNVTSSDTASNISTFIDFDNSLVGWWRMDDTNGSSNSVVDYIGCYDNETEILTRVEVDCDADNPDAHLITLENNNLININNEDSNNLKLDNETIEENELAKAEKDNKCYKEEWKYFANLNDDEMVMTLNQETGKKEWQLPVEKQIYDNGNNDMYKIELEDGSNLLVSEEHKVYAGEETYKNQPKSSIISLFNRTSTSDCFLNLGSFDQIGQFNFNASAKNGISLSCISCLAFVSNSLNDSLGIIFMNVSNSDNFFSNPLVSSPEYFNTSCLFFLNSSIASSGISNCKLRDFDLEMISLTGFDLKNNTNTFVSGTNFIFYQPSSLYLSHMPCLILSPISRASSSNSLSESSCCNICSFQANLLAFDSIVNLTSADQFISGNFFINSLVFSGTDNVIDGILSQSCLNNVKKHKYVEVFKSFDLEEITKTYARFENKEDIWFLDSENNPVRVKSISKEKYNGKIYDVDVENDIVLVRRKKDKTNNININNNLNNEILITDKTLSENKNSLSENKLDTGESNYIYTNNNLINNNNNEKQGENKNNSEIKWENSEGIGGEVGEKVTNFSGMKYDDNFQENQGILGSGELKSWNLSEEEAGIIEDTDNSYDNCNSKENEGYESVEENEINNIEENEIISDNYEDKDEYGTPVWSGNSNNGTAQGDAVQTDAGKLGKGFEFDGNGDYVNVSSISSSFESGANGKITISMWLKVRDNILSVPFITGTATILKSFGLIFSNNNDRDIEFTFNGGIECYTDGGEIQDDTWYHVVGTYNGSGGSDTGTSLYIDGIEQSLTCDGAVVDYQPDVAYISANTNLANNFNGTIDDVMIFNRSLSADEIKALYANQSNTHLTNNFTSLLIDKAYPFKAYTQDYAGNVNMTEERSVTVNQIPTVTLISPAHGNITTNRTPTFTWSGNDAGGGPDALTYQINITCWEGESIVSGGTLDLINVGTATTYTPTDYLKCLSDNNQYYNWTVRAYDGINYSAWATERNISIQSLITISLPVNSVNFGAMNNSDAENTSDNSPAPLVLKNDGNAELNITVNFTDLWDSVLNPNKYFQFKVRNLTNSCFVYGETTTSWTNATAPGITGHAIQRLNFTSGYQTGCDNASIDIKIEVPLAETVSIDNEPRSSIITFISSLGEPKQT